MMKCGTPYLAAFTFGLVAVACSAPPLGIDGHSSIGSGSPLGSAGAIVVPSATGSPGIGGGIGNDAGYGTPPDSTVTTGVGGSSSIPNAAITVDAGAAGGSAQVSVPAPPPAATEPQPSPAPDAGAVLQVVDSGTTVDAVPSVDAAVPDADMANRRCVPTNCGTHSWACWRMPNAENSGLPNPASYTDMGDGTIRDNRTCLLWQKVPYASGNSWQGAKNGCATNPPLEGTGWRLPTRIELISIIDYSRTDPSVVVSVFPSTQPNPPYWTWSPFPAVQGTSYVVSFHEGTVSTADQTAYYLAQCVRGNGEDADLPLKAPPNHYNILVDEVTDSYTGLVWQRRDSQTLSPTGVTVQKAVEYCASLSGGPWRLPSVKELATLVDESRLGQDLPVVDLAAFPSTMAARYWSSTPNAASKAMRWTVNFQDGTMAPIQDSAFVRCVRDTSL